MADDKVPPEVTGVAVTQITTTTTDTVTAEVLLQPGYLWNVAAKKAVWAIGKLVVAVLLSHPVMTYVTKVTGSLASFGIVFKVDPFAIETALTPILFGGFVLLHDYLKVTYKWKWL